MIGNLKYGDKLSQGIANGLLFFFAKELFWWECNLHYTWIGVLPIRVVLSIQSSIGATTWSSFPSTPLDPLERENPL